MQEALAHTNPLNRNHEREAPRRTENPPSQHMAQILFEGNRDLSYLKEFMQFKLPEFDGKMDPLTSEDWMQKVDMILNTLMIMDDADKIRLATH